MAGAEAGSFVHRAAEQGEKLFGRQDWVWGVQVFGDGEARESVGEGFGDAVGRARVDDVE